MLLIFLRVGRRSHLNDSLGRLLGHVVDGVLVSQPIRALDGVVEMIAPIVFLHVAQRSVYSSLGG